MKYYLIRKKEYGYDFHVIIKGSPINDENIEGDAVYYIGDHKGDLFLGKSLSFYKRRVIAESFNLEELKELLILEIL